MPCKINRGGFICYSHAFRFSGYYFELLRGEPMPLKLDGDPSLRTPAGFWDMWDEFKKIPEADREQYLA
ncbi:hypothetical protein LCGC14_2205850 [marine sediment metagenome]|uniref:Uncharacterized protein n=1 Tax=marine sediment metagenome TaxID=412755 RepID=A0A0F9DFJ4_9ZZZZ